MEREEKSLMAKKKRNKFIRILWWSFLIHLILLLLILFFAFKKRLIFIPLQKPSQKVQQKNDIPAALKPRQSAFGTTVLFDEQPEFKQPKAPLMGPEKLAGEEEKLSIPAKEIQPQKPQPKIQVKEEIKEKIEEKIEDIKKPEVKKVEKKESIPELKKIEEKVGKEKAEVKKEEELEKRIKEIEEKQVKLAQAVQQRKQLEEKVSIPKMQKYKTLGATQKDKSPIKRTQSIISMTKGFVENLQHKGNDWLERKGDENKRPSFEELKYLSYESKVNWQLQSCWKQNFAYNYAQQAPSGKAVVDFLIKENGTVTNIKLLQSSGNMQLDNIILKSVELAAPFPPLPKHFDKKEYQTGRIIYVNSNRLGF